MGESGRTLGWLLSESASDTGVDRDTLAKALLEAAREADRRQAASAAAQDARLDQLRSLLFGHEIATLSRLREKVDAQAEDGQFVFSQKWPTSPDNAYQGLIVRESTDGEWVAGIAWERFLSAQGHNPWACMHLCVNVGPLAPGESKTIRGRIYLFPGTRDECYDRFRKDFADAL